MPDTDDALAETARALNEDAKAARKRKAAEPELPPEGLNDDQGAPGGDAAGPVEGVDGAGDDGGDGDDEPENRGLQLMEAAASGMPLESVTLVGDLTTGLLEVIKNVQKPWSAHSQFEKRDLVAKVEHIARIVARQAVDVVAADDRITVKAVLEKIAIGDKTTITLKLGAMPEDDMADAIQNLFHAQKKSVLIVTADADRHMGKRREIVEPDEEELPFYAGSDAPKPADPPADDSDLADAGDDAEDETDESDDEAEQQ